MYRKKLVALIGLATFVTLSACAAPAESGTATPADSASASPIRPVEGTWVDVTVDGDTVALPLSLVTQNVNTHFSVMRPDRRLDFMAYVLDGGVYVRANACPPCHSRGFALEGDVLVCDTCATTFRAKDGVGIQGACVDYPKALVAHRVVDGFVTMSLPDLVAAYDDTLVSG